MKTLTYPSGRVVTYTPDSAGRLVSVVDGNGTNYVASASYNAGGSLKSLSNGSTPALNQNFQYTPRLQLCRITALTSGSVPTSCADTQNIGNVMDRGYDFNYGAGDNGNVMAITNYRDITRSQAFTYDALNRLASGWSSANTGAYSWGENYSIDAWGNLQIAPMSNKAHGGYFSNGSDVTNRAMGLGYDAAGNMTNYTAPGQYVYDQENRLSSTAGMSYTYDGNGERVMKSNTSTGAPIKRYWSMGGNTLAEGDGSGNITAEYVYFGGKRIARIDMPANTVHYYLSDHLGSTSIVASSAGTIEEESDYYPFGTEVVVTAGPNSRKFTGKERDSETGLDEFPKRYYGSAPGRWMTPDPLPWIDWQHGDKEERQHFAEYISNPQSFNMYAYVDNNPETRDDPTGMEGCQAGDKKFSTCTITVTYNKKTSEGTLVVTGQNKGDKNPTILLKADVVVGGNGHVTPTGKFTASVWEKDHVSTKYGNLANTPWSKTTFGGNAFGPYQLHIKELDGQGIYIHGTMGPGWSPTTKISGLAVSETSHGCVRMCNRDDIALHNMMPNPAGNRIIINANAPE